MTQPTPNKEKVEILGYEFEKSLHVLILTVKILSTGKNVNLMFKGNDFIAMILGRPVIEVPVEVIVKFLDQLLEREDPTLYMEMSADYQDVPKFSDMSDSEFYQLEKTMQDYPFEELAMMNPIVAKSIREGKTPSQEKEKNNEE